MTSRPARGAYGRSREELARSAITCFERRGFADTTVEEIAAAAGYSERTFFRQFASKEDVVFFDLPDILEPLARLGDTPGDIDLTWARVCAIVTENSLAWEEAGPELAERRTRLFHAEPQLYRRFLEIAAEWETVLIEVFASARRAEPASDTYSHLLAAAVTAACRSALRVWLGSALTLAEAMQSGLDLIESGFGLAPR